MWRNIQLLAVFSVADFARDGLWPGGRSKAEIGISGEPVETPLFIPGRRDSGVRRQELEIDLGRLAPGEDGFDDVRREEGKREDTAGTGTGCAVTLGDFGDVCPLT